MYYGEQKEISNDTFTRESHLVIRRFSACRARLKALIMAERNRIKTESIREVRRVLEQTIKPLKAALAEATKQLLLLIKADKEMSKKRQLLQTMKGVGPEISMQIVSDAPELGQLSREKISRLVGVAPQTRDSGKKSRYRPISQGRFNLRRLLYMGALVAIRHNPRMRKFYKKLLEKGKRKKVALVAVMHKMIMVLNAMVKNNTPWQSERI